MFNQQKLDISTWMINNSLLSCSSSRLSSSSCQFILNGQFKEIDTARKVIEEACKSCRRENR